MFWVWRIPVSWKQNEVVHCRIISRPCVCANSAIDPLFSLLFRTFGNKRRKEADYMFIHKSCCPFFPVYNINTLAQPHHQMQFSVISRRPVFLGGGSFPPTVGWTEANLSVHWYLFHFSVLSFFLSFFLLMVIISLSIYLSILIFLSQFFFLN